jgi:citrate synthase
MTEEYVPGLAGVPATRSNISYVDGQKGLLEYRGIAVEQLAEHSSFLETSYLLIFGHLPTHEELKTFTEEIQSHRQVKFRIRDMIKSFPESGHPMDALQSCVAALGMFYPLGSQKVTDESYIRDAAVRLLAKLPTMVAMFHRMRQGDDPILPRDDLDHSANFLYMLTGKEPSLEAARVFDVCLILHAEHTVNASTFCSLVTASTLADPYTVITAAIGTLSGPLHGGANEEVVAMLHQIGSPEKALSFLKERLKNKEKIMGLGHRVYKVKDPRATVLQTLAMQLFEKYGHSDLYDVALAIEEHAQDLLSEKGVYPNIDFYSGIVYDKMGIEEDLFAPVFAISRVAGWLAHWREQLGENRIFRPTQIYTGKRGMPYIPLEERMD